MGSPTRALAGFLAEHPRSPQPMSETERAIVLLRAASPLRSTYRQHNADECPLFGVANEPSLF